LRPLVDRSRARASRTSPARVGCKNVMSAPAATVIGPRLLQAQANAVSATMNT
jgi:hypothetical protein